MTRLIDRETILRVVDAHPDLFPSALKRRVLEEELIRIFQTFLPDLQKVVDNIIVNNPDVTPSNGGINIDKIVAIAVIDFLCTAFDKPHLGYIRIYPKN